jgi:calcium-dependent protein kinase
MFCNDSIDSEFKLVDFGMSAKYSDNSMLSAVGTPYFIAPEVITRRYGKQCDL